jgi:hypothetical protein
MANPQKTESKLMEWIGYGLWLAIGWLIFHLLGWHISPYVVYWAVGIVCLRIFLMALFT